MGKTTGYVILIGGSGSRACTIGEPVGILRLDGLATHNGGYVFAFDGTDLVAFGGSGLTSVFGAKITGQEAYLLIRDADGRYTGSDTRTFTVMIYDANVPVIPPTFPTPDAFGMAEDVILTNGCGGGTVENIIEKPSVRQTHRRPLKGAPGKYRLHPGAVF
jgi:hypothetical protein